MAPVQKKVYYVELSPLLSEALQTNTSGENLENYLTTRSNLPGPRMNTTVINAFADLIGKIITEPDPPVERIEELLDSWAALSLIEAPVNQPREILPATSVMSYGEAAVSRPDWWDDELTKLHKAASSARWRTREIVASALQRILAVDWNRACHTLSGWLSSEDPLVIRAVVAAVAEPPLLKGKRNRAEDTLRLQIAAIEWFAAIPQARRQEENVRVLRQALGFSISVAVAAIPETGFPFLRKLAASTDHDVAWIARENLKKTRLKEIVTS